MFFFSKELMIILYKSSIGHQYVKKFAFPFILYYIESPLMSAMTAMNKTKKIMLYDTITSILRIVLLVLLIPKIEMLGVAFATVISSSTLVVLMIFDIIIYFRKN